MFLSRAFNPQFIHQIKLTNRRNWRRSFKWNSLLIVIQGWENRLNWIFITKTWDSNKIIPFIIFTNFSLEFLYFRAGRKVSSNNIWRLWYGEGCEERPGERVLQQRGELYCCRDEIQWIKLLNYLQPVQILIHRFKSLIRFPNL